MKAVTKVDLTATVTAEMKAGESAAMKAEMKAVLMVGSWAVWRAAKSAA